MENDRAHTACLEAKGVIGWSIDYLPVSQSQTMQWLGAGIMLAVTAVIVTFIIFWGRDRLLGRPRKGRSQGPTRSGRPARVPQRLRTRAHGRSPAARSAPPGALVRGVAAGQASLLG